MPVTNLKNPFLIKNGDELPLSIISSEVFSETKELKTSIKKNIGDGNSFEFIGVGDSKIKIPVYLESQAEYGKLLAFVSDGQPMLLWCDFFPLVAINIEGSIQLKTYYKGYGIAELNFTTATSPDQDIESLYNYDIDLTGIGGKGSKKSVLEKLTEYGQQTFSFVSNANEKFGSLTNTNEKVGSFTNTVAAFAATINTQAQGIASASTIVTNPISSIKNSISQVTGGISGIVNSMQNVVAAITQVPGDIDQLLESFLQIGDQLNDLFDLGDPNATLKYNTKLLSATAVGIMTVDLTQDNKEIATFESPFIGPQYFLTSVTQDNNKGTYVLILTSILLNLYENAENINKWNSKDLDDLRISTEVIYQYIVTFKLTPDLKLQLDLARNNFFRLFKELYKRAIKIISVDLVDETFLTDVVYSVNGNYDYYGDTKLLNNVVGTRVKGTILVISNG